MPEVKIGVSGNANTAKQVVNQMTDAVNQLAKAVASANRVPFKAAGLDQASKDLSKLNQQFQQVIAQSPKLRAALKASGQSASGGILNVDWSRISLDPAEAQSLRNRAFSLASRGTAFEQQPAAPSPEEPARRGRARSTPSFAGRIGRAFTGGVGGPVGQIAEGGMEGAATGASEGGGLAGGALGLMKGLGVAALVAGVYKAGQAVSEGYGMAKDRDQDLDALKRQMGDLGISFEKLKSISDTASAALGVNAKDYARLELEMTQASHGADRTPEALQHSVSTSVGFARAYGLDPAQSMGFFGGMMQMNSRENIDRLALQIAEATSKTGGHALASDVMQAVQALASSTSRLSLSAPNVGAIGSAYASMVRNGGAGMTPDNATGILSQANSSMMNMGAAGEAGMNFVLQSLNHEGGPRLNPIAARALSESGLFGSRSSAFGDDSALSKYFGNDPYFKSLSAGPGSGTTNFDAVRSNLQSAYGGDKWLQLDAAQRLFGVNSLGQAATLMQMNDKDFGGLERALKGAGLKPSDVNPEGMATVASLGNAGTMGDLNGIYQQILDRPDHPLTDDEKARLDAAQKSGNTTTFRNALVQTMAPKGQEATEGSDLRRIAANTDNLKILAGEKFVKPIEALQDSVNAILQHMLGADQTHPTDAFTGANPTNFFDRVRSWVYKHGSEGQAAASLDTPSGKDKLAYLSNLEQQYGLPSGVLKGIWGTESSYGANVGPSSMGALGNFQQMPSTIKQYGIKIGDFNSEATGAAKQLHDLYAREHGNGRRALYDYNGVVKNFAAGDTYVNNVVGKGGVSNLDVDDPATTDTKIPASKKGAQTGNGQSGSNGAAGTSGRTGVVDTVVLDMNMNVISTEPGGTRTQTVKSTISVPRGSGTTVVQATAQ